MASRNYFKEKVSEWQKKVNDHREDQLINPFSEWENASHRAKLDKNDPEYGKPIPGSLTDIRGKQANNHVFGEMLDLTMTIDDLGDQQPNGTKTITFGKLFSSYIRVSNKVVGILLRARKRNYVSFEGEMLFQGRDEHVVITLLEVPKDTRVNCHLSSIQKMYTIHNPQSLGGKVKFFQKKSDEHREKQLINPFSDWDGATTRIKLDKNDAGYGKPIPGSETEKRGQKAYEEITGEIIRLTRTIADTAEVQENGTWTVTFGDLFQTYTHISSKLVGVLMRARKQQLLDFEGEMLFQKRDDDVIITLFRVL